MKKIFTFLIKLFVILGFYSCGEYDCGCVFPYPRYKLGFRINIRNIEPKVSVVKVSIKNIDKLKPEAYAYNFPYSTIVPTSKVKKENYTFTRKKENKYDELGNFPDIKYFYLTYPLADVDRVFELKIYKDDALFLTKKLTFRTTKDLDFKSDDTDIDPNDLSFSGHTIKAEVDNMDYVAQINVPNKGTRAIIIDLSKKNHNKPNE